VTVQTFRTRPVTIRAVQYDGTNFAEIETFLGDDFAGWRRYTAVPVLLIRTPQDPGDPFQVPGGWWVIEGDAGEHYARDPGTFDRSHDLAAFPQDRVPPSEPEYLPGYPGKLARPPAGIFERSAAVALTPERIATYFLDHCGNCRDAEFYGRAWGHGNPHDRHVPVIEDGHGPLSGQPCACKTCAPAGVAVSDG
jgi:hypothetical protein